MVSATDNNGWLKDLRTLLLDLSQCEVVEFELVRDGTRIYLRKEGCAQGPRPAVDNLLQPGKPVAPLTKERNGHLPICAPFGGIFYLQASPALPPYVQVGQVVEAGQTVGLVEAMKVFNEIRTEARGRVCAIPARTGELVAKGQVLIQLEKD